MLPQVFPVCADGSYPSTFDGKTISGCDDNTVITGFRLHGTALAPNGASSIWGDLTSPVRRGALRGAT